MTDVRRLIVGLSERLGVPAEDVEAWLDENTRIARDVRRRSESVRDRARELHKRISKGDLP